MANLRFKIFLLLIICFSTVLAVSKTELVLKIVASETSADTLEFKNYRRVSLYADSLRLDYVISGRDTNLMIMNRYNREFVLLHHQMTRFEREVLIQKIKNRK